MQVSRAAGEVSHADWAGSAEREDRRIDATAELVAIPASVGLATISGDAAPAVVALHRRAVGGADESLVAEQ
jgi:hypothetical protein